MIARITINPAFKKWIHWIARIWLLCLTVVSFAAWLSYRDFFPHQVSFLLVLVSSLVVWRNLLWGSAAIIAAGELITLFFRFFLISSG